MRYRAIVITRREKVDNRWAMRIVERVVGEWSDIAMYDDALIPDLPMTIVEGQLDEVHYAMVKDDQTSFILSTSKYDDDGELVETDMTEPLAYARAVELSYFLMTARVDIGKSTPEQLVRMPQPLSAFIQALMGMLGSRSSYANDTELLA